MSLHSPRTSRLRGGVRLSDGGPAAGQAPGGVEDPLDLLEEEPGRGVLVILLLVLLRLTHPALFVLVIPLALLVIILLVEVFLIIFSFQLLEPYFFLLLYIVLVSRRGAPVNIPEKILSLASQDHYEILQLQ